MKLLTIRNEVNIWYFYSNSNRIPAELDKQKELEAKKLKDDGKIDFLKLTLFAFQMQLKSCKNKSCWMRRKNKASVNLYD